MLAIGVGPSRTPNGASRDKRSDRRSRLRTRDAAARRVVEHLFGDAVWNRQRTECESRRRDRRASVSYGFHVRLKENAGGEPSADECKHQETHRGPPIFFTVHNRNAATKGVTLRARRV